MTSIVLKDVAADIELITDDPEERFMTTGVSWEQYEYLLAQLADTFRYRVTYLEGVLEIMAPSRSHEVAKKISAGCWKPTLKRRAHHFGGSVPRHFANRGEAGELSRMNVIAWTRRKRSRT